MSFSTMLATCVTNKLNYPSNSYMLSVNAMLKTCSLKNKQKNLYLEFHLLYGIKHLGEVFCHPLNVPVAKLAFH